MSDNPFEMDLVTRMIIYRPMYPPQHFNALFATLPLEKPMTEAEWLASTDPAAMMAWLTHPPHVGMGPGNHGLVAVAKTSDRKLRLFACACCQQYGVEVDVDPERDRIGGDRQWAEAWCGNTVAPQGRGTVWNYKTSLLEPDIRADLLRHIVGSPWRPWVVAQAEQDRRALSDYQILDIDCLTPLVLDLARQVYNGDQSAAPVLHDALLDAGAPDGIVEHFSMADYCDNPEHRGRYYPCDEYDQDDCRQHHPRGCWAIDLLLGKE